VGAGGGLFQQLLSQPAPEVYSFPVFSELFCRQFLAETEHYQDHSGLPVSRPNTMNNFGLIVNEMGLQDMMGLLQREVVQPVSARLFPVEGAAFDSHHSFVVQYKAGEDLGLDMHIDDADVTWNVCLGREFSGAGLTFCGGVGTAGHRQFSHSYQHVRGTAVVHLGTRRHGADDLQTGERFNLIMWNRNASLRRSSEYKLHEMQYEREGGAPDERCLSRKHDRDFFSAKNAPPGGRAGAASAGPGGGEGEVKEEAADANAWCPPTGKEHWQPAPELPPVALRSPRFA
jgi:hypothetical protein